MGVRCAGWVFVDSCPMSAKRSRVELFEKIRRARRVDPEVSIHELARRFETHRRTVREALLSAVPVPRKPVVNRPVFCIRSGLVLGPDIPVVVDGSTRFPSLRVGCRRSRCGGGGG